MHILDKDIPTAEPAEVIEQYSAWINKVVNRYAGLLKDTGAVDSEDMIQAGNLALLEAMKSYDPSCGSTFISWSFCPIRNAILKLFGLDNPGRKRPPELLLYIDSPIDDEESATLADLIEDPDSINPEEKAVQDADKEEIRTEVHAAVDRLKDEKQKHVLKRIWFDGQDKKILAEEMQISVEDVRKADYNGRSKLYHDFRLRKLDYPRFAVGMSQYKSTLTSAVEKAVLWREQQIDSQYGEGTYIAAGRSRNGDVQT